MKILKFLGLIGLLATLGGIGAAAFFFGGLFSVAANHPDPSIVNWALVHVRQASIARHATDRPPGSLDDPALVREGARAYSQRGCTNCHGGPGVAPDAFSAGLNPPPNLKEVVNVSPAPRVVLGNQERHQDDRHAELRRQRPSRARPIWTVVAFLKKLPSVSDEDFRAWSGVSPVVTVPPAK